MFWSNLISFFVVSSVWPFSKILFTLVFRIEVYLSVNLNFYITSKLKATGSPPVPVLLSPSITGLTQEVSSLNDCFWQCVLLYYSVSFLSSRYQPLSTSCFARLLVSASSHCQSLESHTIMSGQRIRYHLWTLGLPAFWLMFTTSLSVVFLSQ